MKNSCLLLVLIFGLQGCAFYRPNVVNVPLFGQRGQLNVGAHKSYNGTEAQAGYALTNRVGVLGNFNAKSRKYEYSVGNHETLKHHFGELGIGLYKKGSAKSENTVREIFLLAGTGHTSHFVVSRNNRSGHLRATDYHRVCLQADLGIADTKWHFAVSPRLTYLYYHNTQDNGWENFSAFSASYFCAEAAATARYYFVRQLALSAQSSLSVPVTGFAAHKYGYFYNFSPFNFSLGLILHLNTHRDRVAAMP